MQKKSLFPLIYGLIAAVIAFIAALAILHNTLGFDISISVLLAGLCALFFFILSWFRGHASVEIKRIVREFKLTDEDLAQITGLKKTDFPIYHDQLNLILPKHYWPKILAALQEYEKERS